jgi:hypothetical protein
MVGAAVREHVGGFLSDFEGIADGDGAQAAAVFEHLAHVCHVGGIEGS